MVPLAKEREMSEAAEHLQQCPGCERCDYLLDGFYMFCDECGLAGHQDSDGWALFDKFPHVVCSACADTREKETNEKRR